MNRRVAYFSTGLFAFKANESADFKRPDGAAPQGLSFGFDHCSEHGNPHVMARALGVTAFDDEFHNSVEAFLIKDFSKVHVVRGYLRGLRRDKEGAQFTAFLVNPQEDPSGILNLKGEGPGPWEYELNRTLSAKFAKEHLQGLIPGSRHNTSTSSWSKTEGLCAKCGTHGQLQEFNDFLQRFKEPSGMTFSMSVLTMVGVQGPAFTAINDIPCHVAEEYAAHRTEKIRAQTWSEEVGVSRLLKDSGKKPRSLIPRIMKEHDGAESLFFLVTPYHQEGNRGWVDFEDLAAWTKGEGPLHLARANDKAEYRNAVQALQSTPRLQAYLRFPIEGIAPTSEAPEELRVWLQFNAAGVKLGFPPKLLTTLADATALVGKVLPAQ